MEGMEGRAVGDGGEKGGSTVADMVIALKGIRAP
jgi:hypothetical protein